MAVVDLETPGRALTHKQRFKEIGWQVNIEHHRAYKYLCPSVRDFSVEQIFKQYPHKLIETPCGNCIGCRLDYSKDWATRADMEASLYKYNYFITLTYDDLYLNYSLKQNATLLKVHAQKFIKAIRHYFKDKYNHDGIRYLLCGEYSPRMRPHYHLILFNCPLPDLTPLFPTENGSYIMDKDSKGQYYKYSEIVATAWQHRGIIRISEANWYTSAYVAQYVVKKQKGEGSEVYKKLGIQPPFLLMSNRPGIGYQSFINQKGKYEEFPLVFIGRPNNEPLHTPLPRYFRKKLLEEMDDSVYSAYLKKSEINAEHKRSLMSASSSINNQRILKESVQVALQRIRERAKIE